jgi:hypothetical protein
MAEKCELLEECGFFKRYREQAENKDAVEEDIEVWVNKYCNDIANSNKCIRKQIRAETGKPPADNVSPEGDILLDKF